MDAVVLDHLAEDAAVAAADDENLLGVGVRIHGQVGDHLLIREFIVLGALDDVVEHEDGAMVGGLEDEHVLVLALLMVQDLFDLEGHGLAWSYHERRAPQRLRGKGGGGGYLATCRRFPGTIHLHVPMRQHQDLPAVDDDAWMKNPRALPPAMRRAPGEDDGRSESCRRPGEQPRASRLRRACRPSIVAGEEKDSPLMVGCVISDMMAVMQGGARAEQGHKVDELRMAKGVGVLDICLGATTESASAGRLGREKGFGGARRDAAPQHHQVLDLLGHEARWVNFFPSAFLWPHAAARMTRSSLVDPVPS